MVVSLSTLGAGGTTTVIIFEKVSDNVGYCTINWTLKLPVSENVCTGLLRLLVFELPEPGSSKFQK